MEELRDGWASLVAQSVICLQCVRPGIAESQIYPGIGKNRWRKAWQPTPVFLHRESPWTEEPGNLWSMGSQRVRHD